MIATLTHRSSHSFSGTNLYHTHANRALRRADTCPFPLPFLLSPRPPNSQPDEDARYNAFFIVWSLKESFIKAIGMGLGFELGEEKVSALSCFLFSSLVLSCLVLSSHLFFKRELSNSTLSLTFSLSLFFTLVHRKHLLHCDL